MARVGFDDVTKVYPGPVVAVDGLTLDVADGEFLILVGPSGCGKSTALRMVAGLERITDGTITIGDRVVNDVPPKDRDIAMVFQSYALYPHMTVEKNLGFGLRRRGLPRDVVRRRIDQIARMLGLEDLLGRRPGQLSGGQRQRVAMGRALVRNPKVFLFDEPLSNLDAKLRVEMRTELKKLHQNLGVTIVYEAQVKHAHLEGDRFTHVEVSVAGAPQQSIQGRSVVLSSGGFQSDIEWLTRAWGPAAANFLIRGTPYNRGVVLRDMLDQDCESVGDPTQCHAVAIDGRAPKFDGGIVTRLDCVPFSIVVNRDGDRFYNEGEDVWPKRYAIWGRLVAGQPDQIAYIIFDASSLNLFMPSLFPPVSAVSIRELAQKLDLDPDVLDKTVVDFNAAVRPGTFKHSDLDDCRTEGLTPNKTHWAVPIKTPPFYGYPLRPGITFTYMGVTVDNQARIIMHDGRPAANMTAAGELMAGNVLGRGYLAGFGLTIGAVFGRIAGREAARSAHR